MPISDWFILEPGQVLSELMVPPFRKTHVLWRFGWSILVEHSVYPEGIVSGGILTILVSDNAIVDKLFETLLVDESKAHVGFSACIEVSYNGTRLNFKNKSSHKLELNLRQIL